MRKELGKISSAEFGLGGYNDAMLGLHLVFSFSGAGVGANYSNWDYETIEHSGRCKWTEQDRDNGNIENLKFLSKILKDAKVSSVSDLVGVPVEVTLENSTFKEFRILKEVI